MHIMIQKDDFWGEGMEVFLHNPWLTYGIGLHRIREAGLGTELMDDLDEKSFDIEEIRDFCVELFLGPKNELSLRNPNIDFKGFIDDLEAAMEKESLVWNPLKNKLTPWIDVKKLKVMFEKTMKEKNRVRQNYGRAASQDDSGGTRVRSNARRSGGFSASMHCGGGKDAPAGIKKSTTTAPGMKKPAPNDYKRSATTGSSNPPRRATSDPLERPEMSRPTSNGSDSNMDKDTAPKANDLKEYMQQWSHKAPDYKKLKPLEELLVNVPDLFPPMNRFVEWHEYYFKWKGFSEDAFREESGDELKELLRRASRKSKLFLHPDKLPGDLTENQDELFKTIWNVIQESEAATLE